MKVNPNIYRGADIRGLIDQDLTPEICTHIGKAYGTFLHQKNIKKTVVGHDCRLTSQQFSDAFIKGLVSTGVDVTDIGLNMIGTFYWAQYHLDIPGGAFITASHNPAEYNGFKLAAGFSETLVTDSINQIKDLVESENYHQPDQPGTVTKQDVRPAYTKDLLSRFSNFKPLKVLIDPSCTTAGVVIPPALKQAGFDVVEKNCQIDGSFPLGTPDPTETEVAQRLASEVVEAGADVGFTYDADGDRIGIVDETGGIIWNDVLVAIFAQDVLAHHPGATIMYNLLCSKLVEENIKKHGGIPFIWRTGHSFLKKKNQELKAAFIGELSGHFFFSKDFYNHDDGLYSTLRLLDFLSRTGQKLSDTVASLPSYISSPEIKVGCPDDQKVAVTKEIAKTLKKDYPSADIIDDDRAGDGVRLELLDSMFVIRYSQNGPYLTIKFEAKTQDQYDHLKDYISKLLHSIDDIDWSFGVNVDSIK